MVLLPFDPIGDELGVLLGAVGTGGGDFFRRSGGSICRCRGPYGAVWDQTGGHSCRIGTRIFQGAGCIRTVEFGCSGKKMRELRAVWQRSHVVIVYIVPGGETAFSTMGDQFWPCSSGKTWATLQAVNRSRKLRTLDTRPSSRSKTGPESTGACSLKLSSARSNLGLQSTIDLLAVRLPICNGGEPNDVPSGDINVTVGQFSVPSTRF